MPKIKITENELKQVIRESVSEVLTEGNFGMNWDQLSDDEKQKFTNRYYNWNVGNFLKNGFNKQAIDPADVQQRYQAIQSRKQKNGNATLNQEQGQRIQNQVAALTKSAQMAEISFTNISKSLDDLIATTQPQQKPLEEAETVQPTYADTSVIDSSGNTNTTRTYNDNYNFKQMGDNIVAKIQTLKTNIGTMKAGYEKTISTQKANITDLTTKLQQSNVQLAQAKNQAVRSGAAQPAVNQNQAIPAAKPIPQQTTRPAAQAPGTALAQK